MKKRTKKQVKNRLAKLARNCFYTSFYNGLFGGSKWKRLSSKAQLAFWSEFYIYFGVDDLPF